jgi:hypothetical protein
MKKIISPEELQQFRKKIQAQRDPKKTVISVCSGAGCPALAQQNPCGFKGGNQDPGTGG